MAPSTRSLICPLPPTRWGFPIISFLWEPCQSDPGKTDGVLKPMKSIPAFPLVLRHAAASNTALIALAGAPVDIIYFNTHGSSSAMELRDMILPGYKLLQRVSLHNYPAIFNNACLSWTGVGRGFLEIGARCYIGSLWSVDAEQAATFAIAVMSRIIQGTEPIAASIHRTGADPLTERAYVFVGPAPARLRSSDSPSVD